MFTDTFELPHSGGHIKFIFFPMVPYICAIKAQVDWVIQKYLYPRHQLVLYHRACRRPEGVPQSIDSGAAGAGGEYVFIIGLSSGRFSPLSVFTEVELRIVVLRHLEQKADFFLYRSLLIQ